ncbi:hypothetical protein SAMN05443668_11869 [Cryptosporangium aurantiacum]|uniref:Uncharacterized protein n=1 Tax=Cryptosporangium aurantiacum TaxID=134849 RepID=A0A1M7RKJ8_9ACTN|nr:hypothetical protein SAMN05443668_11869 [Cryptosporangium aurantiacum]
MVLDRASCRSIQRRRGPLATPSLGRDSPVPAFRAPGRRPGVSGRHADAADARAVLERSGLRCPKTWTPGDPSGGCPAVPALSDSGRTYRRRRRQSERLRSPGRRSANGHRLSIHAAARSSGISAHLSAGRPPATWSRRAVRSARLRSDQITRSISGLTPPGWVLRARRASASAHRRRRAACSKRTPSRRTRGRGTPMRLILPHAPSQGPPNFRPADPARPLPRSSHLTPAAPPRATQAHALAALVAPPPSWRPRPRATPARAPPHPRAPPPARHPSPRAPSALVAPPPSRHATPHVPPSLRCCPGAALRSAARHPRLPCARPRAPRPLRDSAAHAHHPTPRAARGSRGHSGPPPANALLRSAPNTAEAAGGGCASPSSATGRASSVRSL